MRDHSSPPQEYLEGRNTTIRHRVLHVEPQRCDTVMATPHSRVHDHLAFK